MKRTALCSQWVFFAWTLVLPLRASADAILDGAKKEGQVVFYASMETQSAQRLVNQFETKYPFIKVDYTRIGSEKMSPRLIG